MDFDLTPEATDAAALAATLFTRQCTPERLRVLDQLPDRFDADLWRAAADAGLLGLGIPEQYGGAGLGLLELTAVLIEAGRALAPIPLPHHVITALAIARFGDDELRSRWLPGAASGELILTAATVPARTEGVFDAVLAGTHASAFLAPVTHEGKLSMLLLGPDSPGVSIEPQHITGGELAGRISIDASATAGAPCLGGSEVFAWLNEHLVVAQAAHQLGVVDGALALTAGYARSREQFGRPIGTFQAVSQRLANGYIDVLGARLMLWQAAWRVSEGLPAAADVAGAALWAADAGHQLAHTTVHVHGGVGIDMDGEAQRFFTTAKRGEFLLGGTTAQARLIGASLATA